MGAVVLLLMLAAGIAVYVGQPWIAMRRLRGFLLDQDWELVSHHYQWRLAFWQITAFDIEARHADQTHKGLAQVGGDLLGPVLSRVIEIRWDDGTPSLVQLGRRQARKLR